MKKRILALFLAGVTCLSLLTACGATRAENAAPAESAAPDAAASAQGEKQVATAEDMADVVDVVEEGMEPIYAASLAEGTYPVTVDSSSSMFKIVAAELTVEDGAMTAVMTMSGTGYLYVYMGSAEEAAAADEGAYIAYAEDAEGNYTFTVPVDALDEGITCAAFSKRKEMWYDRTLLFRADSLPVSAYAEGVVTTAAELALADGVYTVEVALEGGSGKASVTSPATLTVSGGEVTATVEWSSSNYDFVIVDGVQYDPVHTEGNSTFEIPVAAFDYKLPIQADTTAMSQPHLIDYTLYFDSATIQSAPEG
ncbi:MAG: hypothetical protein IJ751_09045 [Oscillospiraceae bacterium]|nr:hypothetical protein [Oscillospiraceae bacterium]